MLMTVLAAATFGPPALDEPRVIAASMFKNGYSIVSREIDAPRSGDYAVDSVPTSSLGTLWFVTSEGLKLEQVSSTNVETSSEAFFGALAEILEANAGKAVTIGIKNGDANTGEKITGKIIKVSHEVLVIESDAGTVVLPKSMVTSVTAAQGTELVLKREIKGSKRILRLKVNAPRPGKVYMVALERGLTWVPGYAVDLVDDKNVTVTMKATLMNDLADLNGIEARFITGFPNVAFARVFDPLTSGQSVDQFLGMLQGIGGGGFGGGPGRSRDVMSQNMAPAAPIGDFGGAMDPSTLEGVQAEDLFFYRQPNVTLKRGDRSYYVLFQMKSPYEHIYTTELIDAVRDNEHYSILPEGPLDVWHSLKFKNTSGQPFTTAAATTFKDNQILGQDLMYYTSPGADAELKITKALDIRAEASEEELTRERGALKNVYNQPTHDLVTVKGTILLLNQKKEAVKVRLTKHFTGEFIEATGDPKFVKTAKGLRAVNPKGTLSWTQEVAGGKSVTLSYTYKLFVRVQ